MAHDEPRYIYIILHIYHIYILYLLPQVSKSNLHEFLFSPVNCSYLYIFIPSLGIWGPISQWRVSQNITPDAKKTISQATRAGQVTSVSNRSPRRPSRPLEDSGVEQIWGEPLLVVHFMGFDQRNWGFHGMGSWFMVAKWVIKHESVL